MTNFVQNVQFVYMKTISTTEARKNIAKLVDAVREENAVFLLGRRNTPEAVLLKFPAEYRANLGDIINVNAYSASFDFLKDEPELYSLSDLKKSYV